MTVEKAVVSRLDRVAGCRNDEEARRLRQTLSRKYARTPFPEDFTRGAAGPLLKRLKDKHNKDTEEGAALRALDEIRVHAQPSWNAESIDLFFWFIRGTDQPDFDGRSWSYWRATWLKLLSPTGRFAKIDGIVACLADMTAEDYVGSDRLDLDHLTG